MTWFRSVAFGALLLVSFLIAAGGVQGQTLAPAGSGGSGMHELPPKPSEPPDLFSKYKSDPLLRRALREQARLNAQLRQKQLTDATALLLKIAQDLRTEMAKNPDTMSTASAAERLEQIQKLAQLIQDRETAEDAVAANLARDGVWQ